MDPIPVRLLYSFSVFAQSETITEAAKKLGVTQPALTKQLQALEKRLPQRLFGQTGKRKTLTPFGQDLAEQLAARLSHLHDVVLQVNNTHASAQKAKVRISARREILDRLSDQIEFEGALHFLESNHDDILHALKNRETDLGVTHSVPDTSELVAKPLFRESFQLALPKTLAPRSFSEKDLATVLLSAPCLAYKVHDEVLASLCQSRQIDPRKLQIARVTANYRSLARMVEAGQGWAVLPTHFAVSMTKNWVIRLSSRHFHPRDFEILYRKDLAASPWLKDLVTEIQRVFRRGSQIE
jgi:DNA-binding transcriptional LysR family regulator